MKKRIGLVWMLGLAFAATAQEIIVQYDFNGDPGTAAASTTHADVTAAGDITPTEWQSWDIDAQSTSTHPQDMLWVQVNRGDGEINFNVTIAAGKMLTLNSVRVDHLNRSGSVPIDQVTWYYNDTDDGSGGYTLLGSDPITMTSALQTSTVTPTSPPAGLSATVHLRAVFRNLNDYGSGDLDNFTLNGTIEDAPIQGTLFCTQ